MGRPIKNATGETQELALWPDAEPQKVRAGWTVEAHPVLAARLIRDGGWESAPRSQLSVDPREETGR